MKQQGLLRKPRPPRDTDGALAAQTHREQFEVRSFEVDHVNALWHLDFHHGSRKILGREGRWLKPMLLGVLDDRSRLVCHAQWYLNETVESLVQGFCQALQKRGLPRALMTDNGSAMLAGEFTEGRGGTDPGRAQCRHPGLDRTGVSPHRACRDWLHTARPFSPGSSGWA
jgi:putative transposase